MVLSFFTGLEKVSALPSRAENHDHPLSRARRIRGQGKVTADFYCDSEGLEDFLIAAYPSVTGAASHLLKANRAQPPFPFTYTMSHRFHLDPAAH